MIAIIALALSVASFLFSLVAVWRVMKLASRREQTAVLSDVVGGGSEGSPQAVSDGGSEDVFEERYRPYESNDEMFVARLVELVDANIGNHDLNVDFLAAGMMVSRSLLFNRVRRATGKGIVEFVNGIRIERSIDMFPDSDKSLTEIAELSGFSTLRYYSRVFKSVKGEIPSVYRERILQQKR